MSDKEDVEFLEDPNHPRRRGKCVSVNYDELLKQQDLLIMDLHNQNKISMDRVIYLEDTLKLLLRL